MEGNPEKKYRTWGKSRSNRLRNHDYSEDRPIHVTICTDAKRDIFDSKISANIVIDELLRTSKDLGFRLLCYCLMPDHLHIVISPSQSCLPLPKFLNIFKGRTTTILRKRCGLNRLWQRSAYDHVIRFDEDLRDVIEYIIHNPVRKGLAEKADDYPCSEWFDNEIQRYL